jgi:SAM-dependent methyltransferase
LIDDLVSSNARTVLDVACGTGILARQLANGGMSVLGVEVDPQMAEVAGSGGMDVEVATFEAWEPRDRRFDLVTCAQAWHWIDPRHGALKAASLVKPEGLFVCCWNYLRPHALHDDLADVYQRLAPDCDTAAGVVDPDPEDEPYADALRETRAFTEVKISRYDWVTTYSAREWVGWISTQSDHIQLPPAERADLLEEVSSVVASYQPVQVPMGTYAIFATTRQ